MAQRTISFDDMVVLYDQEIEVLVTAEVNVDIDSSPADIDAEIVRVLRTDAKQPADIFAMIRLFDARAAAIGRPSEKIAARLRRRALEIASQVPIDAPVVPLYVPLAPYEDPANVGSRPSGLMTPPADAGGVTIEVPNGEARLTAKGRAAVRDAGGKIE